MKILIAPDSFKGTLTANEVAVIIKDSFSPIFRDNNIDVTINIAPIADGGEGTSTVLLENLGGVRIQKSVIGPELKRVNASYVIVDDSIAVIEVAETSGLKHCHNLVTKRTTTFGLGELILDALDRNINEIIVCLGGSGTTDGGAGMAAALGVTFMNGNSSLKYPYGEDLMNITSFSTDNIDPRIDKTNFKILSDVNNPLYGKNGAAYVYGPQKGASSKDIITLDNGLKNFGSLLSSFYNKDCSTFPGAGAAGGLGTGCFAFLDAKILPGIETILEFINFDDKVMNADTIITGEGKLDKQSFMGKAISGIIAKSQKKPVYIICGDKSISNDFPYESIEKVFATTDYFSKKESLNNPVPALEKASVECAKHIISNITNNL